MNPDEMFAHGLNERVPVEGFYGALDHWSVIHNAFEQGTYYNPEFRGPGGVEQTTGYVADLVTDRALAWLKSVAASKAPRAARLTRTRSAGVAIRRAPTSSPGAITIISHPWSFTSVQAAGSSITAMWRTSTLANGVIATAGLPGSATRT